MGHPPRRGKSYEKPKKLWDAARIKEESGLKEEFGLKNMRELWKMNTLLRKIRREARRLLSKKGSGLQGRTEQLFNRVKRFLISSKEVSLDDILALTERDILSRRLQTIVIKRGLAKTMSQSRQFITHGHVAVGGRKVTSPSYLVDFDEEKQVDWFKKPIVVTKTVAEEDEDEEKTKKTHTKPSFAAHDKPARFDVNPAGFDVKPKQAEAVEENEDKKARKDEVKIAESSEGAEATADAAKE